MKRIKEFFESIIEIFEGFILIIIHLDILSTKNR